MACDEKVSPTLPSQYILHEGAIAYHKVFFFAAFLVTMAKDILQDRHACVHVWGSNGEYAFTSNSNILVPVSSAALTMTYCHHRYCCCRLRLSSPGHPHPQISNSPTTNSSSAHHIPPTLALHTSNNILPFPLRLCICLGQRAHHPRFSSSSRVSFPPLPLHPPPRAAPALAICLLRPPGLQRCPRCGGERDVRLVRASTQRREGEAARAAGCGEVLRERGQGRKLGREEGTEGAGD